MTGWQCPGCSRCYAPTVSQCAHCGPGVSLTTGTVVTPTCLHDYDMTGTAMKCKKCGMQFSWTTTGVIAQ